MRDAARAACVVAGGRPRAHELVLGDLVSARAESRVDAGDQSPTAADPSPRLSRHAAGVDAASLTRLSWAASSRITARALARAGRRDLVARRRRSCWRGRSSTTGVWSERASATPGLAPAPLNVSTTRCSFVAWSPSTSGLLIPNVTKCVRKLPDAFTLLETFMTWSCAFVGLPALTAAGSRTSVGTLTGRIVRCAFGSLDLFATWRSTATFAPSQLQPRLRRKNSCWPPQNGSICASTSWRNLTFSSASSPSAQARRARAAPGARPRSVSSAGAPRRSRPAGATPRPAR